MGIFSRSESRHCSDCGKTTEHEAKYVTGSFNDEGRKFERGEGTMTGWADDGGHKCTECGRADCGYEHVADL